MDDDPSLHSWVTVQQKDGTQTYGSSTSTASRISYEPDELDDWVDWTSPMQTAARPTRSCTTLPPGRACAATGRPAATVRQLS